MALVVIEAKGNFVFNCGDDFNSRQAVVDDSAGPFRIAFTYSFNAPQCGSGQQAWLTRVLDKNNNVVGGLERYSGGNITCLTRQQSSHSVTTYSIVGGVNGATKYNCVNGQCVLVGDGIYTTLSDCQSACGVGSCGAGSVCVPQSKIDQLSDLLDKHLEITE
jgi:hypothetical protein